MHSPMHSFGESRTQPSTPCSHSMECGGSRSSFIGSDAETFLRRRAFFKSAAAPAASETESIMRQANSAVHFAASETCFSFSQSYSPRQKERGRPAREFKTQPHADEPCALQSPAAFCGFQSTKLEMRFRKFRLNF